MSYFTRYLDYVRTKQASVLANRNNIIARINLEYQTTGQASAIIDFLKGFPFYLPEQNPFDVDQAKSLADIISDFLFNETKDTSYPKIGNGTDTAYKEFFSVSIIHKLIDGVVFIACTELLDEAGNLKQSIDKLFFTGVVNIPAKVKRTLFILSFINHVVIPTILNTYNNKAIVPLEMRRKIGAIELYEKVSRNMLNTIAEKSADKNHSRLKYAIEHLTPYSLKCIASTNTDNFEAAIKNQLMAIQPPKESLSVVDAILGMIVSPVDFGDYLNPLIKQSTETEVNLYRKASIDYLLAATGALMESSIEKQLHDIGVYGKSYAVSFKKGDYSDYLTAHPTLEINDNPIDISNANFTPINNDLIFSLTNYFHYEIMMVSKKRSEVKNNVFIDHFVTKIILYAYSEILTAKARVRLDIFKLFHDAPISRDDHKKFRATLIYNYLRRMLVTVVVMWLDNIELQLEFSKRKLSQKGSLISKVVEVIEEKLAAGLREEILQRLEGFPVYDIHKRNSFCIPLIAPSNKSSIKEVVKSNIIKLTQLKNHKNAFASFVQLHLQFMNDIQLLAREIEQKNNSYKIVMLNHAQLFEKAKTKGDKFDTASSDYNRKLAEAAGHAEIVRRMLNELEFNFHSETKEELDRKTKIYYSQIQSFTEGLTAIQQHGTALLEEIANACGQSEQYIMLQSLRTMMCNYVNVNSEKIKTTAEQARERKKFYNSREKMFPWALSGVAWAYNLKKEKQIISSSFDIIGRHFLAIKEICDSIRTIKQEELTNDVTLIWHNKLKAYRKSIEHEKLIIGQAAGVISGSAKPLESLVDGAKKQHEELYRMVNFIFHESEFWKRRVSPFWGGDSYTEGNITYRFPRRAVAMMKANNAIAENMDPDLKLCLIVEAFNNTSAGYCWRSDKTVEFYSIIKMLDETIGQNFYKNAELNKIKIKLVEFMKSACEPNYQMYARYESLHVSPKPAAINSINPVNQVVAAVGEFRKSIVPK